MKPIEIAEKLQQITKVNIFDNSRKQDIVDLRNELIIKYNIQNYFFINFTLLLNSNIN